MTAIKDPNAGLEAIILRELLQSSNAFRMGGGGGGGGGHVVEDMFVSTLADVLAKQHPLSLHVPGADPSATHAAKNVALQARVHTHHDAASLAAEVAGAKAHITSGFGARVDPINHTTDFHHGLDVGAPMGTPIAAAKDGVVTFAGEKGGYGLVVEIDHGNGLKSRYAHASALLKKPGDVVHEGEIVARVGATGRATGPHVHIEAEIRGKRVDPAEALQSGESGSDPRVRHGAFAR